MIIVDEVIYYTAREVYGASLVMGVLFAFSILGIIYLLSKLFK